MSQTYKLNHIEGDDIKKIYIFTNDDVITGPEYIDSEEKPVFSLKELENIQTNQIPIEIVTSTVFHGDDTITYTRHPMQNVIKYSDYGL